MNIQNKYQEKIDLLRGFIDDYEQGIVPSNEFTSIMIKEVLELEKIEGRERYFNKETDELKQYDSFYRWEFNEEYSEGAENLWYDCKDYTHEGKRIYVQRELESFNFEGWTVQFESLIEENYIGSTEHYLKDVDYEIVVHKYIKDAIKAAENFIRENKEELERL
jgi:hypothetical protein